VSLWKWLIDEVHGSGRSLWQDCLTSQLLLSTVAEVQVPVVGMGALNALVSSVHRLPSEWPVLTPFDCLSAGAPACERRHPASACLSAQLRLP